MNAVILRGDSSSKKTYIEVYVRDNNIPSYNILRYEQDLKIADARQIKKSLSISTSGGKRLVIIEADPNIEAQNALLKTLEELDAPTDFIFSGELELLPTVVSRCRVFVLGLKEQLPVASNSDLMEGMLNSNDFALAFSHIEKFFAEKRDDSLGELILSLRQILIEKVYKSDDVTAQRIYKMLNSLQEVYPLVASNNLNSRLVLEKLVLAQCTDLTGGI